MEKEYSAALAYSTEEMTRLRTTQEEIRAYMDNETNLFMHAQSP
jgi:hypothetical protein